MIEYHFDGISTTLICLLVFGSSVRFLEVVLSYHHHHHHYHHHLLYLTEGPKSLPERVLRREKISSFFF
jgi:hypothetical protein